MVTLSGLITPIRNKHVRSPFHLSVVTQLELEYRSEGRLYHYLYTHLFSYRFQATQLSMPSVLIERYLLRHLCRQAVQSLRFAWLRNAGR